MSRTRVDNHIGTIFHKALSAARALGIAAQSGDEFVQQNAIEGLQSALIVAEEARQLMQKIASDRAEREGEGEEQQQ